MLIAEYDVTNKNDHRALASMALKTREAFDLKEKEEITVLADKGYHTGDELQQCHKNSIITLVAIPKKVPIKTTQNRATSQRKTSLIIRNQKPTSVQRATK